MIFFNLLTGAFVSFSGQLPIGFINLSAVQIAIRESKTKAMAFAAGVVMIEMLYLRIVLLFLKAFLKNKEWISFIEITTVVIFLILAAVSFRRYQKRSSHQKVPAPVKNQNRLLYGIILSALNFAQVPFWIVWSSYAITQKWIGETDAALNFFTIGTGLGTFICIYLYIIFGKVLVNKIKNGEQYLQIAIAVFFLIAAIIQFIQFLRTY